MESYTLFYENSWICTQIRMSIHTHFSLQGGIGYDDKYSSELWTEYFPDKERKLGTLEWGGASSSTLGVFESELSWGLLSGWAVVVLSSISSPVNRRLWWCESPGLGVEGSSVDFGNMGLAELFRHHSGQPYEEQLLSPPLNYRTMQERIVRLQLSRPHGRHMYICRGPV